MISEFNGYFEIEDRGISPGNAYLHVFAKKLFTQGKVDSIRQLASKMPIYKDSCQTGGGYSVVVNLRCTDHDQDEIEKYILSFLEELDANVTNIKYILIDDSEMTEEEAKEEAAFRQLLASVQQDITLNLDSMVGLEQLDLNYSAHVVNFYGESYILSICFQGGAGEAETQAVRDVIRSFDFKLEGDDYAGDIGVELKDGKVLLGLDLGGVKPKNENKVLHGILLALNGIKDREVKDISQVLINEF